MIFHGNLYRFNSLSMNHQIVLRSSMIRSGIGTYSQCLTKDIVLIATCNCSIPHQRRSRCIRRTQSLHRMPPALFSAHVCRWPSVSGCCRCPTKTRRSSNQTRSCSRSSYDRSQPIHRISAGTPVCQRNKITR